MVKADNLFFFSAVNIPLKFMVNKTKNKTKNEEEHEPQLNPFS